MQHQLEGSPSARQCLLSPTGIWALVDIKTVDIIGLDYASNLGGMYSSPCRNKCSRLSYTQGISFNTTGTWFLNGDEKDNVEPTPSLASSLFSNGLLVP